MKFLLAPDISLKTKTGLLASLVVALLMAVTPAFSQNKDIPERPNPPRLVNDFAGLLSAQDRAKLEHKLVAFNDSTSTQIAVVIVKSLNNYEINDYATRLFETWGIGQKGKNNGILVLVKTKTQEEKGKVYITTGYGVESFVTDALSERIVEKEIIPSFRDKNYFEGLDKATNTLMSLVKGQFTADQYMKKGHKKQSNYPIAAIVIIIILAVVFFGRNSSRGRHISSTGADIPFWLLMGGLLNSGNRSGGGFGDFSSGGGDFGSDSDSGFGGFGGGNTGGGGAGGEW